MKKRNSENLMKELVNNRISRKDLETLLEDLDDDECGRFYTKFLKEHYADIMDEYLMHLKKKK